MAKEFTLHNSIYEAIEFKWNIDFESNNFDSQWLGKCLTVENKRTSLNKNAINSFLLCT